MKAARKSTQMHNDCNIMHRCIRKMVGLLISTWTPDSGPWIMTSLCQSILPSSAVSKTPHLKHWNCVPSLPLPFSLSSHFPKLLHLAHKTSYFCPKISGKVTWWYHFRNHKTCPVQPNGDIAALPTDGIKIDICWWEKAAQWMKQNKSTKYWKVCHFCRLNTLVDPFSPLQMFPALLLSIL